MSGIIKLVHSIEDEDGPYMTVSEVAEYFERSTDTIRRWGKQCGVPTHKMPLSDTDPNSFAWLYTQEDLRTLEEFSRDINPKGGRPKSDS